MLLCHLCCRNNLFDHAENTLCAGDHIPWYAPLDGSESRIQHMMMTEDPQLQPIATPFGTVNFVQVNYTPIFS